MEDQSEVAAADETLRDTFGHLALSQNQNQQPRPVKDQADQSKEGVSPKFMATTSFSSILAIAGQPSQCTRQIQKELEHTLLKRCAEAEVLEKKKKKDTKIEIP